MQGFSKAYPAIVFAPEGQTTGLGSAYDNDIAHREVERHLEAPGRRHDPAAGARHAGKGDRLPGVSTDGSHILM